MISFISACFVLTVVMCLAFKQQSVPRKGHVKSNYLQIGWTPVLIYALATLLFPPGIPSALFLFAGSHCKQGAALAGSVSPKPLNYSIQTYSCPRVSSLRSPPAEFVEAEPEQYLRTELSLMGHNPIQRVSVEGWEKQTISRE